MEQASRLNGKRILLGVSGSIAAYKAVELLRRFQDLGAHVRVLMTQNATRFVSRLTFETLSGEPVPGVDFQDWGQSGIGHIDVTGGVDVAVIAPATANIIGKIASGIADDTLTTAVIALECPLVIAPAMNDRMYRNRTVQKNRELLRDRGITFVEPDTGQLACGAAGQGRLADFDAIVAAVEAALPKRDLDGARVLVTAGPTREPIDAVRFISSPSTGKMGFALAAAAHERGAEVVLVAGPTEVQPPPGPVLVRVTSAADMHRAVLERADRCDIIIMAAAVSDFRPVYPQTGKIKKEAASLRVDLERTDDILAGLGSMNRRPILVGFAAETSDAVENAITKMNTKNLDMIIANDVSQQGAGFGSDTNIVTVLDRFGGRTDLSLMTKAETASRIISRIVQVRSAKRIKP